MEILYGIALSLFFLNISFYIYIKKKSRVALMLFLGMLTRFVLIILSYNGFSIIGKYGMDPDGFLEIGRNVLNYYYAGGNVFNIPEYLINRGLSHTTYIYFVSILLYVNFGFNISINIYNALFNILTIYYLYKISVHLNISDQFSRYILPILCFWPSSIYFSSIFVYRDFLLGLLVTLGIYNLIVYLSNYKKRNIIFFIVFISLGGLMRPQWLGITIISILIWVTFVLKIKGNVFLKKFLVFTLTVLILFVVLNLVPAFKQLDFSPSGLQKIQNDIGKGAGTAIANVTFNSWFDVVRYLPKGFITVIFMPLPGLYPIANVFQMVGALENLFVLILFYKSVQGFYLKKNKNNRDYFIIIWVTLIIVYSSIFLPDLGSATRQKIIFLPFLLLFFSIRKKVVFL
jgi:hypothetical protein